MLQSPLTNQVYNTEKKYLYNFSLKVSHLTSTAIEPIYFLYIIYAQNLLGPCCTVKSSLMCSFNILVKLYKILNNSLSSKVGYIQKSADNTDTVSLNKLTLIKCQDETLQRRYSHK